MQYLKKYNEIIFFLLGFFAALPFFFIPYKPFIYINFHLPDSIWNDKLTLYPGYTGSLGLAAPFILVFLTIFFCLFVFFFKAYKDKINIIILGFCLVTTNTIIIFLLSSSLKSLSASSSLIGLFMILILMNNIYFKIFSRGFLICLFIFINFHALSIILNGIKVSHSTHGISIFGIEIYQSLVSYVFVVSFFLSTLILKKDIFDNLFKFENKNFSNILYYTTLFSCVIILVILVRRLAFLIFLMALFVWLFIYFKNNKDRLLLRGFLILIVFFPVLVLINKFFFTGSRGINYVDMIQPRLNAIFNFFNEIFNLSGRDLYLGKLEGWGNIESGFIDIFLNTGIAGFMIYFFTFLVLIKGIYANLKSKKLQKNLHYISFSFLTLVFTNIVNNSFSNPYFFLSFFIIFLNFLTEKKVKMNN